MKLLLPLFLILAASTSSAIEFKPIDINGKTVYSNVPEKCIKDGYMACTQIPNTSSRYGQYTKPANTERALPVTTTDSDPSIPNDIKTQIKLNAEKEWPDNFRMQRFEIEKQHKAYKDIQTYNNSSVPAAVAKTIKSNANNEWQGNYRMQLFEIKKQSDAYVDIN